MTATVIDSLNAMEELAQGLGFQSVFDFTKNQIRQATLQKIAYYQSRIDNFEKKYNMTFGEFRKAVPNETNLNLSKFGIIEKEEDDNDWEDAIDFVEIYSQKLQRVSL